MSGLGLSMVSLGLVLGLGLSMVMPGLVLG